jgi:hypothetical protein
MEKKKTYISPQLKSYGSVQDLTEQDKHDGPTDGHTYNLQPITS